MPIVKDNHTFTHEVKMLSELLERLPNGIVYSIERLKTGDFNFSISTDKLKQWFDDSQTAVEATPVEITAEMLQQTVKTLGKKFEIEMWKATLSIHSDFIKVVKHLWPEDDPYEVIRQAQMCNFDRELTEMVITTLGAVAATKGWSIKQLIEFVSVSLRGMQSHLGIREYQSFLNALRLIIVSYPVQNYDR